VEVCEIGDSLSWSAVPFFVWHSSCCLEVRGCRVECNTVTSRDFVPSLRAMYDICKKMMKPAIASSTFFHGKAWPLVSWWLDMMFCLFRF
jgi:hypothetical protein